MPFLHPTGGARVLRVFTTSDPDGKPSTGAWESRLQDMAPGSCARRAAHARANPRC